MQVANRKVSLSAATTGTGTSVDAGGWNYVSVLNIGTGTISAGTIIIEEADTSAYSGTWSTITTLNAIDVTAAVVKVVHLPAAAYGWVRARIGSSVTGGGSVTIVFRGQD